MKDRDQDRKAAKKAELLRRDRMAKAETDALNLKPTDYVNTDIATVVVGFRNPVSLRALRHQLRVPKYSKDGLPGSRARVKYKVSDLWAWREQHSVDPSAMTPDQKLLYMFSKSTMAESIRYECDKHPDDLPEEVFADDGDDA